MSYNEQPYLQRAILDQTRTAQISPAIEKGIAVGFNGLVAGAGGPVYGITTSAEEIPGTRAVVTAPAAIAVQAYAAGARFVLTAPQAINAGGQAGIYQVITGFTPAATTLTAPEALNVFYVGAQLTPDFAYKYGNSSRVHAQDAWRPGYQYYRSLAIRGQVPCQVGAVNIAVGTRLMSDANGKMVAHTGTNSVVGYAVTAGLANEWITVELRLN